MARTTVGKPASEDGAAPPVRRTSAAAKTATKTATAKTASQAATGKADSGKVDSKAATKAATKAPAKTAAQGIKKAPAKSPAKSPAKKAAAKTAGKGSGTDAGAGRTAARRLAVKPDEDPWTAAELAEVRGELDTDRVRLRSELNLAEVELHDLMRDAGDGAGNDQADVGSTTFERDHEMSLANNARDMLAQTERALARIEDGSYGVCESCGEPIGKMRVMAFPRATLCLSCKQREERR
jgi:RNA polymerase-binding protein DksA